MLSMAEAGKENSKGAPGYPLQNEETASNFFRWGELATHEPLRQKVIREAAERGKTIESLVTSSGDPNRLRGDHDGCILSSRLADSVQS